MEAKRYIQVDKETNFATAVIMYDPDTSKWEPPDEVLLIQSDTAAVGDVYDTGNGLFTRPIEPPPEPVDPPADKIVTSKTVTELEAAIDSAKDLIEIKAILKDVFIPKTDPPTLPQ